MKWVPKVWGGEKWIVNNDKYCGKILHIVKGNCFSVHFHKLKSETFLVLKGTGMLYYSVYHDNLEAEQSKLYEPIKDDIKKYSSEFLQPDSVVEIPPGRRHRILAYTDMEIVEFSTHHEDSDSYRIIPANEQCCPGFINK